MFTFYIIVLDQFYCRDYGELFVVLVRWLPTDTINIAITANISFCARYDYNDNGENRNVRNAQLGNVDRIHITPLR